MRVEGEGEGSNFKVCDPLGDIQHQTLHRKQPQIDETLKCLGRVRVRVEGASEGEGLRCGLRCG